MLCPRMMPLRVLALTVTAVGTAAAQTPESPTYPGRCETPVSQRASDAGCYLVTEVQVGEMPDPVLTQPWVTRDGTWNPPGRCPR